MTLDEVVEDATSFGAKAATNLGMRSSIYSIIEQSISRHTDKILYRLIEDPVNKITDAAFDIINHNIKQIINDLR